MRWLRFSCRGIDRTVHCTQASCLRCSAPGARLCEPQQFRYGHDSSRISRRWPERARYGSQTNTVRHEKSRGRFSLSPREERAGRELERGETDEKGPPLPGPLLFFGGGEGERKPWCAPSKLLA